MRINKRETVDFIHREIAIFGMKVKWKWLIYVGIVYLFLFVWFHFGRSKNELKYCGPKIMKKFPETCARYLMSEKGVLLNETKVILLWNSMWDSKLFDLDSEGVAPFQNRCSVQHCYISTDKRLLPVASAVVFHMLGRRQRTLPAKRYPGQLYVQVNRDAPMHHPLKNTPNVINVTMTYRRDSDIRWPYFKLSKRTEPDSELPLHGGNKARNVAWLANSCTSPVGREDYVLELSKYIDVDVLGLCGNTSVCRDLDQDKCFRHIASTYRYFLSFEDCFCVDYVTHQLLRPLQAGILPVVIGGAKYSRDAPPNSYINALDFQSPRLLAYRLQQLAKYEHKYLRYFDWKKHYSVGDVPATEPFCELCKIVHNPNFEKRYDNFDEWWQERKCNNDVIRWNIGNRR